MELFWYSVLIVMLAVYVVFDGYDFGAGIVHLFFAKKEEDKKLITKSIGPFWDANEVWLIAAGGLLFFAFPLLYASAFSGFYLPLMMILWLLIFRAIGLELREQIHHSMWHAVWDKAFGISSLLLALFFGLALGNVVRGVNLGGVENGVSAYEATYFFLPLWNSSLDPLAERLGVIDWFTLLLGIIAVISLTIHGANWVILKTKSSINEQLKKIIFRLNFGLVFFLILSVSTLDIVQPNIFDNYSEHVWLFIFPILTTLGLLGLFWVRNFKNELFGFLCSTLFLFGGFTTTAAAMYPVLLPSTNAINKSLTVFNTITEGYGLSVGLNWFFIGIILVVLYFVVQHRVFKGKMDDIEYGDH